MICLTTYYVFSIAYPQDHKDVFFFIDSGFVVLQHTATNRISLQKFIKAFASLKVKIKWTFKQLYCTYRPIFLLRCTQVLCWRS